MKKIGEEKIRELAKLLVRNRISILLLLYKQDTCVCEMVEKLNLKHSLISHHLKTLQDMGYIKSKRNGQHIMYSLHEPKRISVKNLLQIGRAHV